MLNKKMKKKQSHRNWQGGKMETINGNKNKKGTFWSLMTLCSQGYLERV